jgi:hypothetical protein
MIHLLSKHFIRNLILLIINLFRLSVILSSKSPKLITNVNQSINNSVEVNVVNLIENKSSTKHFKYEKSFEPTLFELEHSDTTDSNRGFSFHRFLFI